MADSKYVQRVGPYYARDVTGIPINAYDEYRMKQEQYEREEKAEVDFGNDTANFWYRVGINMPSFAQGYFIGYAIGIGLLAYFLWWPIFKWFIGIFTGGS